MQQRTYPLQTRACFLLPEHLESGPDFANFVERLIDTGYNTLVMPALYDGAAVFDVSREGRLRQGGCAAQEALYILQRYPVTVWLSADLLNAAAPNAGRMGSLARRNPSWLMRNVDGGHEVPTHPQTRGLFCWTTLDYRRFVANMLVDILEAFSIDGLLLDISALPRTTENPRTWMQFSFSCLRRMQKELGIDGESFLIDPTMDKYRRIEQWRMGELSHFIESLKMRVCKARQNLPLALMTNILDDVQPYVPWKELYEHGIVEEIVLKTPTDEVAKYVRSLDAVMGVHRPLLTAVEHEADLAILAQEKDRISSLGVCLTKPIYTSPVDFPPSRISWTMPGGLERHPLTAGAAALIYMAQNAKPGSQFATYVSRLKDFLDFCGDKIKFEDVVVLRDDLLFLRKQITTRQIVLDDERLLAPLDLATRLFFMIPAPVMAF